MLFCPVVVCALLLPAMGMSVLRHNPATHAATGVQNDDVCIANRRTALHISQFMSVYQPPTTGGAAGEHDQTYEKAKPLCL